MPDPVRTESSTRLFEGRWVDEGYDFIGAGEEAGWSAVAGWGRDGWDLGTWPYVVVLFRDRPGEFQRAVYVEGDILVETYASAAQREWATDETALFYWTSAGESWLDRGDDLKGPFSWKRLEETTPAAS